MSLAPSNVELGPDASSDERNLRILIVDDNHMIHEDIRKILAPDRVDDELSALEADLFGAPTATVERSRFEITSAMQGQEGLARVEEACAAGKPFALAFVDLRMPPGWDGVETIGHLWRVDPDLQVVICTAYSDYTWAETIERLGRRDNLLILKKPFDVTEVEQLAHALTERWELVRRTRDNLQRLSEIAEERNRSLEMANAELASARAQVARVERLLRRAHERESVGRLAAILSADLDTAIATGAPADAIARTLAAAAAAIREEPATADINATVASAVTYASRQLGLTNVTTDFGSLPPVRLAVGDLHHALVALIDEASRRCGRVVVRTDDHDGAARISIRGHDGAPPEETVGLTLARHVTRRAGGQVAVETAPDHTEITLTLPRA